MAKKRGLGRGIGALIPSTATAPAQPSEAQASATPSEPSVAKAAPASSTESADATPASGRPVDMFFSSEKSHTGAAPAKRANRDLADDWARDAQKKRRTGAKKVAAAGAKPEVEAVEDAATATAAQVEPSETSAAAVNAADEAAKGAVAAAQPAEADASPEREETTAEPAEPAVDDAKAASHDESGADGAEQGEGAAESSSAAPHEAALGLLPVPGAEFAEIPIREIRENPRNPRTVFDEDELDELAYSLREVGVLQPIVVRPVNDSTDGESFEIVMGERRWRAAKRAGLTAIPAIIRSTTDDDLLRDALLENLHRSQLNPLEEAAAYGQLLEDFHCTQDELAQRIGRSRPQISNTLRLLRLPALVQRRLQSGAISAGHARALLSLHDAQLQEELAQRIVNEGLSVRAVERLIANGVESSTTTRAVQRRNSYNPRVVSLTSQLSTRLEAPVRIDVGKRKGKITLEFTNLDDLERLVERLGLEAE